LLEAFVLYDGFLMFGPFGIALGEDLPLAALDSSS
tara:strand:+ start:104 stop:208 length:105 start_codon:yes stop_codon:yes gene_type:complete